MRSVAKLLSVLRSARLRSCCCEASLSVTYVFSIRTPSRLSVATRVSGASALAMQPRNCDVDLVAKLPSVLPAYMFSLRRVATRVPRASALVPEPRNCYLKPVAKLRSLSYPRFLSLESVVTRGSHASALAALPRSGYLHPVARLLLSVLPAFILLCAPRGCPGFVYTIGI